MTVGVIGHLVTSCGSGQDKDYCFDYIPVNNSWAETASLINPRDSPKSSFIGGVWLLSGDGLENDDFPLTTEIWTGNAFEQGPPLPTKMFSHCQLTVNSTHVFFAEPLADGISFLLDWQTQTWKQLPPTTATRHFQGCGLIDNPINGKEAVIVKNGISEIFNFETESWRDGPSVDVIDQAGFAQIGGTFVMAGGENEAGDATDKIYLFDRINSEWILKEQKLQIARKGFPGIVAVPFDFVSCS